MLHELGGTRQDFNLAWDNFQAAGISTFAFDFRGHGQSDPGTLALADLRTTPGELALDVVAALDYVLGRDVVDPSKVGLIGLDVGANLALLGRSGTLGAGDDWGVASVVAISPDVAGIEALGAMTSADLILSNVQYVAGATNPTDADEATTLHGITTDPRDLRLVKQTGAHGANLLSGSPDAQTGVATWFAARFSE